MRVFNLKNRGKYARILNSNTSITPLPLKVEQALITKLTQFFILVCVLIAHKTLLLGLTNNLANLNLKKCIKLNIGE